MTIEEYKEFCKYNGLKDSHYENLLLYWEIKIDEERIIKGINKITNTGVYNIFTEESGEKKNESKRILE